MLVEIAQAIDMIMITSMEILRTGFARSSFRRICGNLPG